MPLAANANRAGGIGDGLGEGEGVGVGVGFRVGEGVRDAEAVGEGVGLTVGTAVGDRLVVAGVAPPVLEPMAIEVPGLGACEAGPDVRGIAAKAARPRMAATWSITLR
jgi:hypothetical protein